MQRDADLKEEKKLLTQTLSADQDVTAKILQCHGMKAEVFFLSG